MGTSVVADDRRAVFYQNTSERAFGPTVSVATGGKRANRKVANRAIEKADKKFSRLWSENPDRVHDLIREAKRELYPAAAPDPEPESEAESEPEVAP